MFLKLLIFFLTDPLAFQALQLAAETSEMIDTSSYTEVETTTTTAVPVSPSNGQYQSML